MDDKWVERVRQDQHVDGDQAWLLPDWVSKAIRSVEVRQKAAEDPFPRRKTDWIVKYPALLVVPVVIFGACFWLFVVVLLGT